MKTQRLICGRHLFSSACRPRWAVEPTFDVDYLFTYMAIYVQSNVM